MMSDTLSLDTVQSQLGWVPRLDAGNIGVSAKSGVFTLTGNVPTFAEKCAAEAATRRVKGVRAVAEELELRSPFSVKHDNLKIATGIVNRFAWDMQMPQDHIKATVEKVRVVLTGKSDWQFLKKAAEDHIRYFSGVVSVSNQLTLKPRVSTETSRDDIDNALDRSWFFDPDTIHVTANGGAGGQGRARQSSRLPTRHPHHLWLFERSDTCNRTARARYLPCRGR